MKRTLRHPPHAVSLGLMLLLATACSENPAVVDDYTLPYFPWMDPYVLDPGERRFFDIEALMDAESLSRLEAVEVQNQYRDRLFELFVERTCELGPFKSITVMPSADACFTDSDRATAFSRALTAVRGGRFESGWSLDTLDRASFVVAFDLDETLFSEERSTGELVMSPGWDDALSEIRQMGGLLVLFTARPDDAIARILADWYISTEGRSQLVSQFVDGVFTNHHLVLQASDAAREHVPVVVPSKDLRIIDPSLTKVIIVDDNPSRIWHRRNLRYVRKWKPFGDDNSAGHTQKQHSRFYEQRLRLVVDEIRDSKAWAEANNRPLVDGFLPYSHLARQVTQDLAVLLFGGNLKRAADYVRLHPEVVDRSY